MLLAFVMFASLAYRAFRASVVQSEPRLLLQSQRLCPVVLRLDAVLADDARAFERVPVEDPAVHLSSGSETLPAAARA